MVFLTTLKFKFEIGSQNSESDFLSMFSH